MVYILLFLHLLRPLPALKAADLDFIIIDKYYSSLDRANLLLYDGWLGPAGYGDFLFLNIKDSRPVGQIIADHKQLMIFSSQGVHHYRDTISFIKPVSYLLLVVRDTGFVDVFTAQGQRKVVLTRRQRNLRPVIFLSDTGHKITAMIVRQPQRHKFFFASYQRIFSSIGQYYFLINLNGRPSLRVFRLSGQSAKGQKLTFYPDSVFIRRFFARVFVLDNEFVIDYDTFWLKVPDSALVNYSQMDTNALLMMKYATEDNFTHTKLYDCARCLLRYRAAKDLLAASRQFLDSGYKIVLYDCYRPVSIQRRMWEVVHNINYVAPPSKKSSHNRGAAIDITLMDMQGNFLDMGTAVDYFGPQAGNDYPYLSPGQKANRKLLQTVLRQHNFSPIRTEWWHFYHLPSITYPALDMPLPCGKSGF